MKLIYAIAEYLNVPNEWIVIDKVRDNNCWFHVKGGTHYTCTITKREALKAHSIRAAAY